MSAHADEKSDKGIVPKKQSNKEGSPLAETVEGRPLPKGNSHQSTVVRTPSRAATSDGLLAMRRAARRGKDVQFTALLHHVTTDLLKQSYLALKRDEASGCDGVT